VSATAAPGSSAKAAHVLLALAAALALADGSIVTLGLPEILVDLDTTVEAVAAVIAVYAVVLALALPIAGRLVTPLGRARLALLGLTVFGAASLGCGAVDAITPLLVLRGVQAAGGAAVLVAAFGELRGAERGARLWIYAAIIGSAAGPALGGALTELWSWRAIFYAQVPVAVAAALVYLPAALRAPVRVPEPPPERLRDVPAALALALASASLAAILFLLVLMLVAGFSHAPLAAAASVSVLPVAALLADRLGGSPRLHATAGSLLIASGVACVAFLPGPELGWVLIPGALAGAGMGLALPALAGDLLPERNEREAARLLSIRHAGIAIAILGLAPVLAHQLDSQTREVRLQGTALILDAKLDPRAKLQLAPRLVNGIQSRDPRNGLKRAVADIEPTVSGDQAAALDSAGERLDEVLVHAVVQGFRPAIIVCAGLGLLAALLLLLPVGGTGSLAGRAPAVLAVIAVVALAAPAAYAALRKDRQPEPVAITSPCLGHKAPGSGGITGFLQDVALKALDRAACRYGSTREELVLAIADEQERRDFEKRYGQDPRSVLGLLGGALLGGG
jgi:MFS family permease